MAVPRLHRAPRPTGDFAMLVREPGTRAGRLQRGVQLAVEQLPVCDHAGVTILTPHFVETVAASDDVVRRGDDWQYELSEGPGLDSVRSRATIVSQDLKTDARWRSWAPLAVDGLGVRSSMSLLLDSHDDTVGSLSLYADRTAVWDDEQQTLARGLADLLAVAVADARTLEVQTRSLRSRAGIGQAQGIVMERLGMTAEQAFEHLRRLALRRRVTLVHLADHIVETRELPALRGEDRHQA
jgi:GAF domain-containing protein